MTESGMFKIIFKLLLKGNSFPRKMTLSSQFTETQCKTLEEKNYVFN